MLKDNNAPKWRIPEWFPEFDEDKLRLLKAYHSDLIRFTNRLNLISSTTIESADEVHFADSLLGAQIILKNSKAKEIFDIGTGNGCPGLIMSIIEPSRQFVLVDRDVRKIEFLKTMIARLELNNVKALRTSVEDLPEESIECAVSRAFSSITGSLLALGSKVRPGGSYYHFKSVDWYREVANMPVQLCQHWKSLMVESYSLPVSSKESVVVVLNKDELTAF